MRSMLIKAMATEEGVTRFVASTSAPDRAGDVVAQDWRLDAYKSNPVILWAHDASIPPVGRATRAEVVEGQLEIDVEWDRGTELGATVARQFEQGFLKAGSVGFIPGSVVPRSAFEEDDPSYGERGLYLAQNELLEFSAVPVPANAQALAKGQTEARETGRVDVADLFARQEVREALREAVRKAVDAEIAARPAPPSDSWDW